MPNSELFIWEIDDQVIQYLEGRFEAWSKDQDSQGDIQTTFSGSSYVPVRHRYGNILEEEDIHAQYRNRTPETPQLLVTPSGFQEPDEYNYINDDYEYQSDTREVIIYGSRKRLRFDYDLEGIADDWVDYRLLQSFLYFQLPLDIPGKNDAIELFGNRHLLSKEDPQQQVDEQKNRFRVVQPIQIDIELYTLPGEVKKAIEDVIVNYDVKVDPLS